MSRASRVRCSRSWWPSWPRAAASWCVRRVFEPQTITAYFSSATGLYPGDEVRIAGVKVGTIRSITPQPEHAAVTLEVDHDVRVPADAKAVIVAQNLVAARYVQLAPLYRAGEPRLERRCCHPEEQRTAVPIEWDEVKTQLSRLATELGPDSTLSSSSAGRFIDSTADAMQGNGDKLRQTFAQLSQLARILSDGSGDVVATIENLQTFVTALARQQRRPRGVPRSTRHVQHGARGQQKRSGRSHVRTRCRRRRGPAIRRGHPRQDRRTGPAAGECNAGAGRPPQRTWRTSSMSRRRRSPTPTTSSTRMCPADSEHSCSPTSPTPSRSSAAAIGAVENATATETGKLCAQYLGPALRLLSFNISAAAPTESVPDARRDAGQTGLHRSCTRSRRTRRAAGPQPPAVSAYTGRTATCRRRPDSSRHLPLNRRRRYRQCCCPQKLRPQRFRPMRQHRRQPKGHHHRDLTRNPAHRRCGAIRRSDGDAADSAASTRCRCRVLSRVVRVTTVYHVQIANVGYSRIELAGDDRRCHRRQRREDPREKLPRRSRRQGQARRRGSCQRDRKSRTDQPAWVDASGPRSAGGRAADAAGSSRVRPSAESFVDLPVDRADAVVAVGCRSTRAGSVRSATSSTAPRPRCPVAKATFVN